MMNDWTFDALWAKARLFADRAHGFSTQDPLFALWSSFALELLARSCLAYKSPCLLADPREGVSILYAVGVPPPKGKEAKSIPFKTVMSRCRALIPELSEGDATFCLNLLARRNRELHSGGPAFENFDTRLWLAHYYRVSARLLSYVEKTVQDYLPLESAQQANAVLAQGVEKVEAWVRETIRLTKSEFFQRPEEERRKRRDFAEAKVQLLHQSTRLFEEMKCPVCASIGVRSGEKSKALEPVLRDSEVVQEITVLATHFECYCCGLILDSYPKLDAAGGGGTFTVESRSDAMEWFEFDLSDYEEPDYGND